MKLPAIAPDRLPALLAAMLLAACGDNTSSAGNNSGSTSTEKITGSFSGAGATSQIGRAHV